MDMLRMYHYVFVTSENARPTYSQWPCNQKVIDCWPTDVNIPAKNKTQKTDIFKNQIERNRLSVKKNEKEMKQKQQLTMDNKQERRDGREQHIKCQRRIADDQTDSSLSSCWMMMILLVVLHAPLPATCSTAIGNWM